jgi:tetratricopeptide (TPR) repeat protein
MKGEETMNAKVVAPTWITFAATAAVSAFLAGGASAWAAPKYQKQEKEITGVPQTQLTKPQSPPKEQAKKGGPVITLEEFVGKRTEKIKKLNEATIEKFQRLIKITPDDSPDKPDFHFRIAELYAEQQRFFNFQARSLDEKIFQAKGGEKMTLERQQKSHEDEERKWLLKAVEAYVAASQFKKYDRMDEVLFKLAYLLQSIKKEEQAREFFLRLIKEYPNSKYVPDAYLSFAEFYFDKGEMEAALKFYEKVENYPKSPVYGYAFYKKGWCYINLGQFKQALQIFIDVIRLAQAGKASTNPAGNKALEREAKKDVVRAYARTPGATPDKAWELFQRVGGDFAPKMMEALAELYWEQGMFNDSTHVYHKLMVLNPQSHRLCEWQNKVVRNTLSAGTKKKQVEEINRLGAAYDRTVKMQGIKADVIAECKNSFHDTSKELALVWHKEAQKTKNPDTYQLVKFVYKDYLDRFSGEKGSVDLAFYYAEVLWMTEDWRNAAEQYTKVVETDPKGKWAKESAYAAVLAWKNALAIDDTGAPPVDHKSLKPVDIPAHWKKMLAAFDTYIKYVPDSPELPKIRYRKARVYYEHNHFEEAARYFQEVVDKHPNDELAIYSANLLLDAYNAAGKPKEVIKMVDRFLENPNHPVMKDAEFAKNMVTLKVDSYDLEARQYSDKGEFKACGISFLAAAESLPDSPKHAERLYNAGTCFAKARLIGQAVKVRNILIEKHPNDKLAQRALHQIASGYHQLAYYGMAAPLYEKFATKFPGEKQAPEALGNAFHFRVGLGEYDKAVQDMNDYIKFYGTRKPQDAAGVFFQMAQVYEKEGRKEELLKHLDAYLKKWGNQGGIDRQIYAHFRMGELLWKKSCAQEGVYGACVKIERVSATGRQKAFYEINKRIKDKKKKLKEPKRTTCGPPTSSKITVFDRNKGLVKQAMDHFNAALKLFAGGDGLRKIPAGPEAEARAATATSGAAGSAFYQAEQGYEEFLRVKFPEGLEFQEPSKFDNPKKVKAKTDKLKEDKKKFQKYFESKTALLLKLAGPSADKKGAYDRIVDYKVAHWFIAASARIGQVWANFMDQLYTAEIPRHLKEQDEWGNRPREMYCDTLMDQAEPLEVKAVQGYDLCLKGATEKAWFNEWSDMCEKELNQMQPSEYPLAAEDKPDAGYMNTLMTPAPVMTELPASAQPLGASGPTAQK